MKIKCNTCGREVSGELPDGTAIDAWIECRVCCIRSTEESTLANYYVKKQLMMLVERERLNVR